MSDKISDEYLIQWRSSIPHRDSQIHMLREFAEIQVSALDELLARRAAEAKPVKLPETFSMLHRTKFSDPYHTEKVYKRADIIEAIKAAGGSVEGEE